MNLARSVGSLIVLLLLGVALVGCDIAGSARLSGTPIGGSGSGEDLDESSSENIVAYFYAERPVKGLLYSCAVSGIASITGPTDENGKFVCPRNTVATFFVGVEGVATIRLGQVPLEIFGDGILGDSVQTALITPATLLGTGVDERRRAVVNMFNLLATLDKSPTDPAARKQAIIDLDSAVITYAVSRPSWSVLAAEDFDATPSGYAAKLKNLATEIQANAAYPLRLNGEALTPLEATAIAKAALLRARSGLYRTTIANDNSLFGDYSINGQFLVGHDGRASGFASVYEVTRSGSVTSVSFSVLDLAASSKVLADGALQDFLFSGSSGQVDFFGSFVNDRIWGLSRLCQPESFNLRVPALYCSTSSDNGGFSTEDAGKYRGVGTHEGQLFISRPSEVLPDVDLDKLPVNYLPRTFEMSLTRYSGITRSSLSNVDYSPVGTSAQKAVFGSLTPLVEKLRYTVMPNGDIVSDVDTDCESLSIVDGLYYDAGNNREYLIGRVANAFEVDIKRTESSPVDLRSYITFQIAVMDQAHPYFGLSVGFPSLYRTGLHPMVLEERGGNLRSKSCDPKASAACTHVIEWFNDLIFLRDIATIEAANRDDPRLPGLYRDLPYYGQVLGNAQVDGAGGICPALPAPSP